MLYMLLSMGRLPLRRRRFLSWLHKLQQARIGLANALYKFKLANDLQTLAGREPACKALIVACAYGNPMSRANTRDDGPCVSAPARDSFASSMMTDVEVQCEEPTEIIIQVNGEQPAVRGDNYEAGTPLRHSHEDGRRLRDLLRTRYKFSDIDYLSDDGHPEHTVPTAENIKAAIRKLVLDARPGDSLVFAFIGHGGQRTNKDGQEIDGRDEIIFAIDKDRNLAEIVDNEIHDLLVKPLPAGCKLTAIIDACHSGTALDLKYSNEYPGSAYGERLPPSGGQPRADGYDSDPELSPTESLMVKRGFLYAMQKQARRHGKFIFEPRSQGKLLSNVQKSVAKAKVFCLSACRDEQVTYEWKNGYTLTDLIVKTIAFHKKGVMKQRRLLAKVNKKLDEIHAKRPEFKKPFPQLGSNIKRYKWKHEPFILHKLP